MTKDDKQKLRGLAQYTHETRGSKVGAYAYDAFLVEATPMAIIALLDENERLEELTGPHIGAVVLAQRERIAELEESVVEVMQLAAVYKAEAMAARKLLSDNKTLRGLETWTTYEEDTRDYWKARAATDTFINE